MIDVFYEKVYREKSQKSGYQKAVAQGLGKAQSLVESVKEKSYRIDRLHEYHYPKCLIEKMANISVLSKPFTYLDIEHKIH